MQPWDVPTDAQLEFLEALKKRLRVTTPIYEVICQRWCGKMPEAMTKRDISKLLDVMQSWVALPADLQRLAGQRDLFTLED